MLIMRNCTVSVEYLQVYEPAVSHVCTGHFCVRLFSSVFYGVSVLVLARSPRASLQTAIFVLIYLLNDAVVM